MTLSRWIAVLLTGLFLTALPLCDAEDCKSPQTIIRFTGGAWDKSQWKPMRLANQAKPAPFFPLESGIGTTMESFTKKDYAAESDNAILLHDLGNTEAEFAVTFTLGKGFGGFSCPGLCISPVVKDDLVESSIAIFVADYTMAVWHQTTDADGKTVRIKHLVQLGRWSDPAKPHTLRCRISKKEASVAIKLDDADVIVLCFVGNAQYGSVTHPVNALVGLWGCHGECTFRDMTIFPEPTLPFLVRTPVKAAP